MSSKYEKNAKILKALGDVSRLKIIDLLSCGDKCGCEILECFEFTQPTLSHHMKVLIDCGLIEAKKDGVWSQYKINISNANKLLLFLMSVFTEKEEDLCTSENSENISKDNHNKITNSKADDISI